MLFQKKMGSLHPNIAPYGEKVITKDKVSFLLAIGTDKQFLRFSSFIGLSKKSISENKSNKKKEFLNRAELIKKIQKRVSQISANEFSTNCIKLNIPIGKINTTRECF